MNPNAFQTTSINPAQLSQPFTPQQQAGNFSFGSQNGATGMMAPGGGGGFNPSMFQLQPGQPQQQQPMGGGGSINPAQLLAATGGQQPQPQQQQQLTPQQVLAMQQRAMVGQNGMNPMSMTNGVTAGGMMRPQQTMQPHQQSRQQPVQQPGQQATMSMQQINQLAQATGMSPQQIAGLAPQQRQQLYQQQLKAAMARQQQQAVAQSMGMNGQMQGMGTNQTMGATAAQNVPGLSGAGGASAIPNLSGMQAFNQQPQQPQQQPQPPQQQPQQVSTFHPPIGSALFNLTAFGGIHPGGVPSSFGSGDHILFNSLPAFANYNDINIPSGLLNPEVANGVDAMSSMNGLHGLQSMQGLSTMHVQNSMMGNVNANVVSMSAMPALGSGGGMPPHPQRSASVGSASGMMSNMAGMIPNGAGGMAPPPSIPRPPTRPTTAMSGAGAVSPTSTQVQLPMQVGVGATMVQPPSSMSQGRPPSRMATPAQGDMSRPGTVRPDVQRPPSRQLSASVHGTPRLSAPPEGIPSTPISAPPGGNLGIGMAGGFSASPPHHQPQPQRPQMQAGVQPMALGTMGRQMSHPPPTQGTPQPGQQGIPVLNPMQGMGMQQGMKPIQPMHQQQPGQPPMIMRQPSVGTSGAGTMMGAAGPHGMGDINGFPTPLGAQMTPSTPSKDGSMPFGMPGLGDVNNVDPFAVSHPASVPVAREPATPLSATPISAAGTPFGRQTSAMVRTNSLGAGALGPPPPHTPVGHGPPQSHRVPPAHQPGQPGAIPPPPPLPAGVNLDPRRTKIETISANEAAERIPPLSEEEVTQVKNWMKTDDEWTTRRRALQDRAREEILSIGGVPASLKQNEQRGIGDGWTGLKGTLGKAWYEYDRREEGERRRINGKWSVKWPRTPQEREKEARERERAKLPRRREGLRVPRKLRPEDAAKPEQLVPIRLEFDVDHNRMRDTFVWNLNDPIVTPEAFAQTIVDDYGLAPSFHSVITKSIQEQLSDFQAHATSGDGDDGDKSSGSIVLPRLDDAPPGNGKLDQDSLVWWQKWREQQSRPVAQRVESASGRKRRKVAGEDINAEVPQDWDAFEFDEDKFQEEMRIVVKLDIIVGSVKLDDQIEWDLDNPEASPEAFAEVYARDLGLAGEFKTAVAHLIREQVQAHQKSLFLSGPLGTAGGEDDVRASFLPPLSTGARAIDQVSSFTPLLNYISDSEIEKTEREREKELIRRRKRNTRGRRGVALPDREPQRTYRTPAIGFPPVDPANLNQSVLMNQPTSRRAAAAAAQINIANMVASENRPEDRSPLGTPVMASMTLQTSASLASSQPAAAKEPKQKGLFKAPTIPQSVLKPRATISAPTPSTAASSTFLLKDGDLDEQPVVSMVDVTRVPENRGGPMNPKRARELEREAKEREYMDGQHANNIDGEWHCSNCGCPASIAVGRRKGPLGDKTQCGPCGKYWHRHRRPRPVEYHSDLAYHQNQRDEAARAKNAGRRRARAAAVAEAEAEVEAEPEAEPEPEPESPMKMGSPERDQWAKVPRAASRTSHKRAASPASSESSASEAPLAEQIKKTDSRSSAAADTPADTEASAPPTQEKLEAPPPISRRPSSVIGGGSSKFVPYSAEDALENPAPEWLVTALTQLRERYPHDRLELMRLHRPSQETNVMDWRVKCDDCQEKLYRLGPEDSLSNFEVHLKNRGHRDKVYKRSGRRA